MFQENTTFSESLSKPPIQKQAGLWPAALNRLTTSICLSKPAAATVRRQRGGETRLRRGQDREIVVALMTAISIE